MDFANKAAALKDLGLSINEIAEKLSVKPASVERYLRAARQFEKESESTLPSILVFDIETSPMKSYHWGTFKQNIHPDQIIEDWHLLTWSAKWLFEDNVLSDKLSPQEVLTHNDSRIAKTLWELFDEADAVIAHNAIKFDVRRSKNRFLVNGLTPNTPYKIIDTLRETRHNFPFSHNKLDYITKRLEMGRKLDTDFSLWRRCLEGDSDAMDEMERYNIQDVKILEEYYLFIRPWLGSANLNMGLFTNEQMTVCPHCGSSDWKWTDSEYTTTVGAYSTFRCDKCGGIGRGRKTNLEQDVRKYLASPIRR